MTAETKNVCFVNVKDLNNFFLEGLKLEGLSLEGFVTDLSLRLFIYTECFEL